MGAAKLLIDVFEKLQQLQENHLELFVLAHATSDAFREKFPELHAKHMQAVTNSEAVQKLREQQRIARLSIEAAKKQLLGGSGSN